MARSLQVLCIKKLWPLHTHMCKNTCTCSQNCFGEFNNCPACFYSMYRLYENRGGFTKDIIPMSKGIKCSMTTEQFWIDYDIPYTQKKDFIRFMTYHIMFNVLSDTEKNEKIINMTQNIKESYENYVSKWYNDNEFNDNEVRSIYSNFRTILRRVRTWCSKNIENRDQLLTSFQVETWIGSRQKCHSATHYASIDHSDLIKFIDADWIDEKNCAECIKNMVVSPLGRDWSIYLQLYQNQQRCMNEIGFYSFVLIV